MKTIDFLEITTLDKITKKFLKFIKVKNKFIIVNFCRKPVINQKELNTIKLSNTPKCILCCNN